MIYYMDLFLKQFLLDDLSTFFYEYLETFFILLISLVINLVIFIQF